MTRVTIAGQGFAGLTLGMALLRRNIPVTFLGEAGEKASSVAIGLAAVRGLKAPESSLFAAKMQGQALLRKNIEILENALKLKILFNGVKEVFVGEADFVQSVGRTYRREFRGLFHVEDLGTKFLYPDDFFVDVPVYLQALKKYCKNFDCEFLEDKKIVKIEKNKITFSNSTEFVAKHLVLALGGSINQLLNLKLMREDMGEVVEGFSPDEKFDAYLKGDKAYVQLGRRFRCGALGDLSPKDFLEKYFPFVNYQDLTIRQGVRVFARKKVPLCRLYSESDGSSLWIKSGYHKSGLQLSPFYAEKMATEIQFYLKNCAD